MTELQLCIISCKIFEPLGFTSRIQQLSSQNSDLLHSKMAPLWCQNQPIRFPLGKAVPAPFILDMVFLIQIDSLSVLCKLVSKMKYTAQKPGLVMSTSFLLQQKLCRQSFLLQKYTSLQEQRTLPKYKSTSSKTLWPVRAVTSSKETQIGTYSISLALPRKLGC